MKSVEEDLIEKAQKGDLKAFEKIVELYQNKVYGIVYHMIKKEDEVEDVAQEVFIKIYRNINKFQGKSSFYTWVYRITANMCIDTLKKKQTVIYLDEKLKTEEGEIYPEIPSDDKRQDELYEQKELKEKLNECIEKLEPKQKLMIILRDIKGFSYEEIAKISGQKLGTVKSQINRARLKLKELLEKDGTFVDYIESKQ